MEQKHNTSIESITRQKPETSGMSPSKDLKNTLLTHKNSLQNESKIKTFADKHKLKKPITSSLSLKEIPSSSRRKRISSDGEIYRKECTIKRIKCG